MIHFDDNLKLLFRQKLFYFPYFYRVNLKNQIFNISSDKSFENLALETFQYQYHQVNVYREFCDLLKVNPSNVKTSYGHSFSSHSIF